MKKIQQRTLDTKVKILKAAKSLFLQYGFAGTAMGKIAEKACVNHSLLFHHFGNKAHLWVCVKEYIVKQATLEKDIIPSLDLLWGEFLLELLENSYNFYLKSSDIQKLIYWQRVEKNTKGDMNIRFSDESVKWLEAIGTFQKRKEVKSNIKPEFIMTMITSLMLHVAVDPNFFLKTAKAKYEYLQFCHETLLKATT